MANRIKLIIVVLISILIWSCSDDEPTNQDPIVGNWKIESIELINLGDTQIGGKTLTECVKLNRLTFSSNQSYSFTDVEENVIDLECCDKVQSISNGAWTFDSINGYQLSGFVTAEVFVFGYYEILTGDLSQRYDQIILSNDNNLLTLQKDFTTVDENGDLVFQFIQIEEYSRE